VRPFFSSTFRYRPKGKASGLAKWKPCPVHFFKPPTARQKKKKTFPPSLVINEGKEKNPPWNKYLPLE
jgi:hypothetical protein